MREPEPAPRTGPAAGAALGVAPGALPPLPRDEQFEPTTARQRQGILALTVVTVTALWWLLLWHPGGDYRLYDPICPTGQERGCVGGLADVTLIPATEADALPLPTGHEAASAREALSSRPAEGPASSSPEAPTPARAASAPASAASAPLHHRRRQRP